MYTRLLLLFKFAFLHLLGNQKVRIGKNNKFKGNSLVGLDFSLIIDNQKGGCVGDQIRGLKETRF